MKSRRGFWNSVSFLYLDNARLEFTVPTKPVAEKIFRPIRMNSKAMPKRARAHMKYIRGVSHSVSFRGTIPSATTWTDSEYVPKSAMVHMKSVWNVCHAVSFHATISCTELLYPSKRKVPHLLGRIQNKW